MNQKKIIFFAIALLLIVSNVIPGFPLVISAPIALLLGFAFTNLVGNPYAAQTSGWTKKLLQYAIIGLGFGINAGEAVQASTDGLWLTVITIFLAIVLGMIIARWLRISKNTGTLISVGTAICGGSAIAAVSPVINASNDDNSLALGTVFTLNAVALFVFPTIGTMLELSQYQFGIWSAVAIHDTSSVVGAASKYGDEALRVATTVKLARALWIIPIAFGAALLTRKSGASVKFPYFILWFLVAILLHTFVPTIATIGQYIVILAKAMMVLTLFLIGNSLTIKMLRSVGLRPFLLGVILWVLLGVGSLYYVMRFI